MKFPIGGASTGDALAALAAAPRMQAPQIAACEYLTRIEAARQALHRQGADALVVGAGDSLRYFTGLAWQSSERLLALVLGRRGPPVMVAPYFEAGSLLAGMAVSADLMLWHEHEDPHALCAQAVRQHGGAVLLDPELPLRVLHGLRRADARLEYGDGGGLIAGLRACKSPAEIACLQAAMAATLRVQRAAASVLAPGLLASDLVRFIDAAHRALGASGSHFCAVQFAVATAYPHGLPADQELRESDAVLVDTGCRLHGYHSDITRSYAFGSLRGELRGLWETERDAQQAAFAAMRPGVACAAVDGVARRVLERAGLGPLYALPGLPHRTGHGIGLSIHEPPWLAPGQDTVLREGMCASIEPMIVVPDRFGIRLEDHVRVGGERAAWFTEPATDPDDPLA